MQMAGWYRIEKSKIYHWFKGNPNDFGVWNSVCGLTKDSVVEKLDIEETEERYYNLKLCKKCRRWKQDNRFRNEMLLKVFSIGKKG